MEPYLLAVYVTIEQETAIRELFAYRGWALNKYGYANIGHHYNTIVDHGALFPPSRPAVYQLPTTTGAKLSSERDFVDGPTFSPGRTSTPAEFNTPPQMSRIQPQVNCMSPTPELVYNRNNPPGLASPSTAPYPVPASTAPYPVPGSTPTYTYGHTRSVDQCQPRHQGWNHSSGSIQQVSLVGTNTDNLSEPIRPVSSHRLGNLPRNDSQISHSGNQPQVSVDNFSVNPQTYTHITAHSNTPVTNETNSLSLGNSSDAHTNRDSSQPLTNIDTPDTQGRSDDAPNVTTSDRNEPERSGTWITEEDPTPSISLSSVTSDHKIAVHVSTQTTLTVRDIPIAVANVDACVNTTITRVNPCSDQTCTPTMSGVCGVNDTQTAEEAETDFPSNDPSTNKRKTNTPTNPSRKCKKAKDNHNAGITLSSTNMQDGGTIKRNAYAKQMKNIRKPKIKDRIQTRQNSRTLNKKCNAATTSNKMKSRQKRNKNDGHDVALSTEHAIESVKAEATVTISNDIPETVKQEPTDFVSSQAESSIDESYQITLDKNRDKIPKGHYHCDDCNVTFKSYLPFINHKRNGGQCLFVCHMCGKSFTFKDFRNYKMHIKYHNNERDFPCSECGKSYFTEDHLATHIRSQHRKERPYVCDKCGQSFAYSSGLISHTLWRHSTKAESYACDICGKKYVSKYYVARHKKCVHTDVLAYTCDICERQFKTKPMLSSHVDTHSDVKRFSCDLCGRRFRRREGLKTHQLRHNNERNFACGQCGRAFYEQRDLVKHTRLHSGDRPYACDVCTFRATRSETLSRHKKTHSKANTVGKRRTSNKNVTRVSPVRQ